jgi:hypothetical protein
MKILTDDPDWAPELYEARAMRPARRLSRSHAMVHPRPWLERWPALATFTGSLPRQQTGVSKS